LTETFLISENSTASGVKLFDLDLCNKTGVTVIAVVRQGKAFTNPDRDFIINPGDILVLLGSHKQLHDAMELLSNN